MNLPLETDERLIEIAHGTWEGRIATRSRPTMPTGTARGANDPANVAFEGGERLSDVATRWRAFADAELLGETRDVLVVTHDAVVRCALLAALIAPSTTSGKFRSKTRASPFSTSHTAACGSSRNASSHTSTACAPTRAGKRSKFG